MNKKYPLAAIAAILFGIIPALPAQDVIVEIVKGGNPVMAVPDLRGSGAAQNFMGAFNETLFNDLNSSGLFTMAPKGMYPLQVPQRPEDFRQPPRPGASMGGLALSDWASPPVQANFLATGYTAETSGQIVLYGWLFDVSQPNLANAQVIGKRYFGSVDEAGALGRHIALRDQDLLRLQPHRPQGSLVHGSRRIQSEAAHFI
jgi:TolB protein